MSLRNNVGYPLNHENTRTKIFLKELKRSVFPYRDFVLKFLKNYNEEKFDSWLLQEEQMRSDAKGLIEFFLELKKKFGSYIPRKRFEKELEHNTRMIDDWSLRQVERNIVATAENNNISSIVATQQVQTASGGSASSPTIKTALRNVNIESGSITEQIIKSSIKTNVDLISKLDQEYKNKVEKILHEGFASSRSRKEMAEEIAKVTGVQLNKAEFWVRDCHRTFIHGTVYPSFFCYRKTFQGKAGKLYGIRLSVFARRISTAVDIRSGTSNA